MAGCRPKGVPRLLALPQTGTSYDRSYSGGRVFPGESGDLRDERPAPLERRGASRLFCAVRSRDPLSWRRSAIPSRRSSRRTHSSLTAGRSPSPRQYSASFATDHFEYDNPRSRGSDRATSISRRNCSALRIGGRPLGFATRSNVRNPLSLNLRIQWYATVKWHPIRSAASSGARPRCTSSMTRYRWWIRALKERSLSFRPNTWRSGRVRRRSCTRRGMEPPPRRSADNVQRRLSCGKNGIRRDRAIGPRLLCLRPRTRRKKTILRRQS